MLHNPGKVYLLELIAVAVLAGSSSAQEPARIGIGSRVRVTLHGSQSSIIGQLIQIGPDSLAIAGEKARDSRVVLQSSVRQIEVSLRQEYKVTRGIVRGGLVGTLVTGAVVLVAVALTPSCEASETIDWQWCHQFTAGKLLAAIGLGAATGAYLGGTHAARHPRDTWAPGRLLEGTALPSSKPQPILGLGLRGDSRVLLVGLSISR